MKLLTTSTISEIAADSARTGLRTVVGGTPAASTTTSSLSEFMLDSTWLTPIRSAKAATMGTTEGISVAASMANAPNACPVVVSTLTRMSTCVVSTSRVTAESDQKVSELMRRNM
jgi:hypothetical protein